MISALNKTKNSFIGFRTFASPTMLAAGLGVLFGLAIIQAVALETRWLVYLSLGFVCFGIFLMVRDKERLIWVVLVLGLQFNVSLRLLYGQGGSGGLVFPLPVVAAMIYLGWLLITRRIEILRPIRWGGPLAPCIAILFLASMFSVFGSESKFVGLAALFAQFQLYLIYFLALNCIRSERDLELSLKLLFLMLAMQSLIYYVQSALGLTFSLIGEVIPAGEIPRPGGTVASHPSGFCNFTLPILLMASAHFLAADRKRSYPRGERSGVCVGAGDRNVGRSLTIKGGFNGWFVGVVVMLGVGALALTLTRASWAAFVLGLAWIVAFGYRRKLLSSAKLALVAAAAAATLIAVAPKMAERLEEQPLDSSYDVRKALMQIALIVIEAHPFVGVGLDAYHSTYKKYIPLELEGKWKATVHNYYLLRTAETGIPGGVAWVLLLVVALRQAMKARSSASPMVRATALGWAGGLIGSAFSMYWDMWTWFTAQSVFWFLLGLMGAAAGLEAERRKRNVCA